MHDPALAARAFGALPMPAETTVVLQPSEGSGPLRVAASRPKVLGMVNDPNTLLTRALHRPSPYRMRVRNIRLVPARP
jgi:hypothetical protein